MSKATFPETSGYESTKPVASGSLVSADIRNALSALFQGDFAALRPRAQSTPDMTIHVNPAVLNSFSQQVWGQSGSPYSYAGGNTGSMSAPSANPRYDIVYLNNSGSLAIITGAEAGSPTIPWTSLPTDAIAICVIYHKTTATKIVNYEDKDANTSDSYIALDVRPFLNLGGASASDVATLQDNLALMFFLFETQNSLTYQLMEDGWTDTYSDQTGIDTSGSTNERFTTGYYDPTRTASDGGDGADGALTISSDTAWTDTSYKVAGSGLSGAVITCVNDPVNIAAGDDILLWHMQGAATNTSSPPTGAAQVGKWELGTVSSVNHGAKTITLTGNITNTTQDSSGVCMVIRVPNYTNVTINSTKTLTAVQWTGSDGASGVIAFKATGTVTVTGTISANGKGFRGGTAAGNGGESWGGAGGSNPANGTAAAGGGAGNYNAGGGTHNGGDGRTGGGGGQSGGGTRGTSYNGGAGGGGGGESGKSGGGGAGYGTAGSNGGQADGANEYGAGGGTFGGATLASGSLSSSGMSLGCGGGAGGSIGGTGLGGNGGGAIFINAETVTISGAITCNGANGGNDTTFEAGAGGGGSGGAIRIKGKTLTLGSGLITSTGGAGGTGGASGANGGAGGSGRIAIYYGSGGVTGTTSPSYSSNSQSWTDATLDNMTLISASITASATPTSARIVLFEEDVDSVTLNTDLLAYASRDGGTTWTQITLANEGNYASGKKILAGSVSIAAQPSGTSMKYKIVTANNKDLKIHGTSLTWK